MHLSTKLCVSQHFCRETKPCLVGLFFEKKSYIATTCLSTKLCVSEHYCGAHSQERPNVAYRISSSCPRLRFSPQSSCVCQCETSEADPRSARQRARKRASVSERESEWRARERIHLHRPVEKQRRQGLEFARIAYPVPVHTPAPSLKNNWSLHILQLSRYIGGKIASLNWRLLVHEHVAIN